MTAVRTTFIPPYDALLQRIEPTQQASVATDTSNQLQAYRLSHSIRQLVDPSQNSRTLKQHIANVRLFVSKIEGLDKRLIGQNEANSEAPILQAVQSLFEARICHGLLLVGGTIYSQLEASGAILFHLKRNDGPMTSTLRVRVGWSSTTLENATSQHVCFARPPETEEKFFSFLHADIIEAIDPAPFFMQETARLALKVFKAGPTYTWLFLTATPKDSEIGDFKKDYKLIPNEFLSACDLKVGSQTWALHTDSQSINSLLNPHKYRDQITTPLHWTA